MPAIRSFSERLQQPLWSGWRLDSQENETAQPLIENLNLFVSGFGNIFETNMQTHASLISGRSALIRRIGVFASFDDMRSYEEFWRKGSFDLIINDRSFHSLEAKNVDVPEKRRFGNGLPEPTHKYGYFGWFPLKLPLEIAQQASFSVQLHSSPELVEMMEKLWHAPRKDFASITIFLDIIMKREVI